MAGFDDITVTRSDGRLKVKAPYNPLFARRSRALGGTFDDKLKTWTFDMRVERLVFEALDKYFWWHKGVDAKSVSQSPSTPTTTCTRTPSRIATLSGSLVES